VTFLCNKKFVKTEIVKYVAKNAINFLKIYRFIQTEEKINYRLCIIMVIFNKKIKIQIQELRND